MARTAGRVASINASGSLPSAFSSRPTTCPSCSKRRCTPGVKMSGALRGNGSNRMTGRSLIVASLRCREAQRLRELHILCGEPEPDDAPVGPAEARGVGLELDRMAAVVGEAESALGVGGLSLTLLVRHETALEQHHGGAAHRPPRGIDHPPLDDAVVVSGDVGVP